MGQQCIADLIEFITYSKVEGKKWVGLKENWLKSQVFFVKSVNRELKLSVPYQEMNWKWNWNSNEME